MWRAPLRVGPDCLAKLRRTLEPAEIRQAEKFHFRRDRDQYVAAHGALRSILACYLGIGAADIRFKFNRYGKPAIDHKLAEESLSFNASHSNWLALFAITRGRRIGVDVEYIRTELESEAIASNFFASREIDAIRKSSPRERIMEFYRIWTRKEAYVKAVGRGLSIPLHQFDVVSGRDDHDSIVSVKGAVEDGVDWSLVDVDPGDGYVGAVGTEGRDWILRNWHWEAEDHDDAR